MGSLTVFRLFIINTFIWKSCVTCLFDQTSSSFISMLLESCGVFLKCRACIYVNIFHAFFYFHPSLEGCKWLVSEGVIQLIVLVVYIDWFAIMRPCVYQIHVQTYKNILQMILVGFLLCICRVSSNCALFNVVVMLGILYYIYINLNYNSLLEYRGRDKGGFD